MSSLDTKGRLGDYPPMPIQVKILADSMSPVGERLTTFELTYPRFIHSELMTHRLFSRNSASSRAIPIAKMIAAVESNPVVPIHWGRNEAGMQAFSEVEDTAPAERWWREGITMLVEHAKRGAELGLHKQIVNRILEPGMWITVIVSSTSWENFLRLRVHPAAEPHIHKLAALIQAALKESVVKLLQADEWHLPLISEEDIAICKGDPTITKLEEHLAKISVGRCARVSYLTHDGKRDHAEDVKLHDKLMESEPLHASPAEHVAQALDYPPWFASTAKEYFRDESVGLHTISASDLNKVRMEYRKQNISTYMAFVVETVLARIQSGNFRGFRQYRKTKANEHAGEELP